MQQVMTLYEKKLFPKNEGWKHGNFSEDHDPDIQKQKQQLQARPSSIRDNEKMYRSGRTSKKLNSSVLLMPGFQTTMASYN